MYRFLTFVKRWQFPVQAACVVLLGVAFGRLGGWFVRALMVNDLQVPPPIPKVEFKDEEEGQTVPLQYFSPITDRNLFAVDVSLPKLPLPGSGTELGDTSQMEKSRLSLELMGTIAGSEKNSLAVIRAKANNNVDVFRAGDNVFNQAKVVKIERMRVVLDRGGRPEILELQDEETAGAGGASRPEPESASMPAMPRDASAPAELEVREKDDHHFEIDRAGFEAVVSDLTPLLTQARVVPHFEEGKLIGYKIFAIKSGSVYEKIGLRNGDVMVSINGNVIDDPTKAMQLLTQLKTEEEFKIDIIRGGKPATFQYNLR